MIFPGPSLGRPRMTTETEDSVGSSFRNCISVMSARWPMPSLVDCGGGKPGTSSVMSLEAGAITRDAAMRGVIPTSKRTSASLE